MQIKLDASLKAYNTFGLNVTAKYLAEVHSTDEIKQVLNSPEAKDIAIIPLGGGSNVLLTKNLDALVVLNKIEGITLEKEDDEYYYVTAGSGVGWHEFVLHCIHKGWGGVENLSLIPGSVGAAPMQNIGAYGVELKDVFWFAEAMELSTQLTLKFKKDDCHFGYRTSVFKTRLKNQTIITKVGFKLNKEHNVNTNYGAINDELVRMGITDPSISDISQAVIKIRQSKLPDPAKIGNSGSFFKNPLVDMVLFEELKSRYPEIPSYQVDDEKVKVPAGWLIESAGWKGTTVGNRYGVHENQALVLVNYGGATGEDIYELSELIIDDIIAKYGIHLEREVNIY